MSLKSPHACLKQIKTEFNDTDWYIVCHLSNQAIKKAKSIRLPLSKITLLQQLDQIIRTIQDTVPKDTKLQYVRYEHSFLLAYSWKTKNSITRPHGPHGPFPSTDLCHKKLLSNTIQIRNSLKNLFKKKLQIQIKSIEIYDAKSNNKIPFLGYFICHPIQKDSNFMFPNKSKKINLLINSEFVMNSLYRMGFCNKFGKPKPNFYYYQKSQYNAIARASSILRGLACYYELAESKRTCISQCSYIITHSLALTFAAKCKLKTRSKVFRIAGPNLQTNLKLKPQRNNIK